MAGININKRKNQGGVSESIFRCKAFASTEELSIKATIKAMINSIKKMSPIVLPKALWYISFIL
ncbi:hypothetical protein Ctaglu_35100 [Clostridium tagluense]|uniref:Uncharacterized protein n=1 Tax=Clostridium tagluense TaxID=360422 RepID=A0A401UQU0_9CLOT|nr:hypothetical protein Ctaglu_35100 [Clostridium tagluense]